MSTEAGDNKQPTLKAAAEKFQSDRKHGAPKRRGVYHFVSFDLCNSTAYKRAQSDWPLLFSTFYAGTWERIAKDDEYFKFWKHLGDEVLIYREVRSVEDVQSTLKLVQSKLHSVIESLYGTFPHARTERLSIKGTNWLCLCEAMPSENMDDAKKRYRDGDHAEDVITYRPYEPRMGENPDFLGPGIDAGFRLSATSAPGVICGSLELALVSARTSNGQPPTPMFKIVDHQELKGIWQNRPYPVLWYDAIQQSGKPIDAKLSYDDTIALSAKIKSFKDNSPDYAKLQRIAEDVGIWRNVEEILAHFDKLKGQPPPEVERASVKPMNASVEVHCVAICIDPDTRKCLVAKRIDDRAVLPNTWEFGCARMREHEDFTDALRRSYLDTFRVELSMPKAYQTPISTYFVDAKRVPGLIFAAPSDTKPEDVEINTGRHSQVRWVTLDEAIALEQGTETTVPDFANNIRKALELFDRTQAS